MIASRAEWMTAANGATLARAAAIPAILALLAAQTPAARVGAAALFALAALTDALDGYLARRQANASGLGSSLDLIADKLLVAAVLIALVEQHVAPPWAAIVIVAREIVVSGVRAHAALRGQPIPAQWAGKLKTAVTSAALALAILQAPGAPWLLSLAVALTVVSALPYLASGLQSQRPAEAPQSTSPSL